MESRKPRRLDPGTQKRSYYDMHANPYTVAEPTQRKRLTDYCKSLRIFQVSIIYLLSLFHSEEEMTSSLRHMLCSTFLWMQRLTIKLLSVTDCGHQPIK